MLHLKRWCRFIHHRPPPAASQSGNRTPTPEWVGVDAMRTHMFKQILIGSNQGCGKITSNCWAAVVCVCCLLPCGDSCVSYMQTHNREMVRRTELPPVSPSSSSTTALSRRNQEFSTSQLLKHGPRARGEIISGLERFQFL